MLLHEEMFEKYLKGEKNPLVAVVNYCEAFQSVNRTLKYDPNTVDYIADFFAKNDEIIRKQPHYIDVLIDLIVENEFMLFEYYLLSNLRKYGDE